MDFDTISTPLAARLAEALRQLATAAKAAAWSDWSAHGISATQRSALLALTQADAAGLRLAELAERLRVSTATASVSIAALEAKGLLAKHDNPADARSRLIRLTRSGRSMVARLAASDDPVAAALAGLSDTEREAFYGITLKMIRSLQTGGHLPAAQSCTSCRHFEPWRDPRSDTPHYCHLVDAPFGTRHLRLHCPEHEAAEPEVQRVVWARFAEAPSAPRTRRNKTS